MILEFQFLDHTQPGASFVKVLHDLDIRDEHHNFLTAHGQIQEIELEDLKIGTANALVGQECREPVAPPDAVASLLPVSLVLFPIAIIQVGKEGRHQDHRAHADSCDPGQSIAGRSVRAYGGHRVHRADPTPKPAGAQAVSDGGFACVGRNPGACSPTGSPAVFPGSAGGHCLVGDPHLR